jgi:tetratricopeptide (TPR) repeat protein
MRLAVPILALLIGLATGWFLTQRRPAPEPLDPVEIAESERRADDESTVAARLDPGGDVPEPQIEAADLKREAVLVARQVMEAYPDNALSHALLGSAHYNTGQSEEAIRHLRRCLELDPGLADAHEILARIAYERGELDEAVRLGRQALDRGAIHPEVLNQLGRALMDLGETIEAVAVLDQAVELPRATSESFYLLGQANLQSGRLEQARKNFQRAIELLPDHTQAYFGLYTACLRLGQTDEADRYRERFLQLEEVDRQTLTDRSAREDILTGLPFVRETVARTFFGAAQIYLHHNEASQGGKLLRRAAALDADNPMYRAVLESFHVRHGTIEEGIRAFERLAADQPDNGLNFYFLGRLHDRLDRFDPAERAYRKVVELAPDWAGGHRALADLYLRGNVRPREALILARKALELEPSGLHYYLVSIASARNNDRPAAIDAMERAVTLSPNEPRYRALLDEFRKSP